MNIMEIKRKDDGKKGSFDLMDKEKQVGKLEYVWAGEEKFIIEHTEVDSEYGGQGLGRKLVMAAVDFARQENVKIIPLCPYAKRVFEKSSEISDVLSS